MKLLKTLLPLAGTVATAASIAPLTTSCSTNSNTLQYNFSYDYRSIDGLTPYEPKFEPLAQQSYYGPSDDVYAYYCKAMEKDWSIFADDILCGTYASLLGMLAEENCPTETLEGSWKVTVNDIKLTYDKDDYAKGYGLRASWTEELNLSSVWTKSTGASQDTHTYHGDMSRKIIFKNIPLLLGGVEDIDDIGRMKYCLDTPYVDEDAPEEAYIGKDKSWKIEIVESTNIDGSTDLLEQSWDYKSYLRNNIYHDIGSTIHTGAAGGGMDVLRCAKGYAALNWVDSNRDLALAVDDEWGRICLHVDEDKNIVYGSHYMSKNYFWD